MLAHPCILGDSQRQEQGAKSEAVTNKREQSQKWLPHPCLLLRGLKEGRNAMSPAHSRVSPRKGNKIRSGSLSCALPGALERAEILCEPCSLRDPQQSDVATTTLPSPEPKRGQKCYVTLAFSGVTNKGEQNQKGLPDPCLLRGLKDGGMLRHPCILGDPQCQAQGVETEVAGSPLPSRGPKRWRKHYVTPTFSGIRNKGEQNQKWLPHPCLLGGGKRG